MKVVLFSYHHVDFLTKLHELLHRTKFILFLFFSWSSRLSFIISFSSLDYHFLRLYLVSDTLFFLYSILLFHEHSTDFLYLSFYIDLLCHFHLYTAPIYTAVARSRFVSYFSIFSSSFSVYLFFNLSSFYLSIYLIHLPFFLFLLFSISSIQLAHSHLLLVTHMIRLWIYLVKY